ncbi:MAG: hypothetical protein ACOYU2_08100 [Nitrospirota bacterium]
MNISFLVQQITPLYNKYRENKNIISGTEALEIMWDIGDILKQYIEEHNIAPHRLFWSVYGNAEGTQNVAKKSYITREFQNRCHRIRKIFSDKEQIRKELPNLRSFTTFREAMPFLDNEKYKFKGKEKEDLLALLNSDLQPQKILDKIRSLQKEKIGIRNPRTQRLHEVENGKQVFIDFYNFIYKLTRLENYDMCLHELGNVNSDYIKVLSKNVSALSQEGLKFIDFNIPDELTSQWKEFSQIVKHLISQKDAKMRRRFRRLIPVERIVRLADMLYGLVSEENFKTSQKRI